MTQIAKANNSYQPWKKKKLP